MKDFHNRFKLNYDIEWEGLGLYIGKDKDNGKVKGAESMMKGIKYVCESVSSQEHWARGRMTLSESDHR